MADGTTVTGQYSTKLARKTPECKAFVNPYKEGEPNGQMEIYFGDGGYYRGSMEGGRIVGQGDYQSAFNEVISGHFENGVLHGPQGFIQNQIEEVFMGEFYHGELHGKGTYQSKRGDSYEGYWQHNMRHGRGVSHYHMAGCYRGFYQNNLKHGKGSLEFGFSKSKAIQIRKAALAAAAKEAEEKLRKEREELGLNESAPPATAAAKKAEKKKATQLEKDKTQQEADEKKNSAAEKGDPSEDVELSEFNKIFQGYFFANGIANKGCVMSTKLQMPSIISRSDSRATYGITKVLKQEDRLQKTAIHSVEKLNDIEGHIRGEIQKKKYKIFKQQKHFTKKTMYAADLNGGVGYGGVRELQSKLFLRKERLHNLSEENHLFKKALVPRLRIPNNSSNDYLQKAFERIRPDAGEVDPYDEVDERLLKILLSDFEEVQERQRFLKYDRIWQRAEDAYLRNRSANA
jgi:hypothetical protein